MDREEQPQHNGGCKRAFLAHGTNHNKATRGCIMLTCMGLCCITAVGRGTVGGRCQVRMAAAEHDVCIEMGPLSP